MSDIGARSGRQNRSFVRQAAEGIGIVTLAAAGIALAAFLLALLVSLTF